MRRFKLLQGGGNYHGNAPLPAAKKAFTQLVKSGIHRQVFQIRELDIENPEVVEKSYPDYWHQLQKLGFKLSR